MKKEIKKDLKIFGLIWAAVFCIIALMPLFKGEPPRVWALYVTLLFVISAFFFPEIYQKTHFYQSWIKLGGVIGKINSKIIIFILFYFICLPVGLVLKILKKDLLSKKIDQSKSTYFIDRDTQPGDMKNQF